MLQESTVDGGLWFTDPECTRQFPAGGEIHPPQFHAFASCLASLHWQASQRSDALGDTTVLEYAPGFEIEARVVQEAKGPRLMWIGYEARRDWSDGLPTITNAALESLRSDGDPAAALDADTSAQIERELRPGSHPMAWFKICLDATGAVTRTEEREVSSFTAWHAFEAAMAPWRFRAFTVNSHELPVCAMVHFDNGRRVASSVKEALPLPAPPSRRSKKPQPVVLADGAKTVEAQRISGSKNIEPDDATKDEISKSSNPKVIGTFRVCLDDTGHVESVLPLNSTGFASYDRTIIAGINTWVYSPFVVNDEPYPVCTAVTFIYRQTGTPRSHAHYLVGH